MPQIPQKRPTQGGQPTKNKIDPSLQALIRPVEGLIFDPDNARLHPDGNIEDIKASLTKYGQRSPIVVDRATGHVMKGNGTLRAARELGWTHVAAAEQDFADKAEAVGYGIADNRTGESSRWDFEVLARLDQLMAEAGDAERIGWSADELAALRSGGEFAAPEVGAGAGSLAERFLVPPFSVLDARQGYWQDRKRAWLALGIKSELGRGDTPSTSARVGPDDPATYSPIGGRKTDNGLLGISQQARSHYKNATPGGSPLPAATLKGGKTIRGDGRGRPLAATFGSGAPGDLAAGFKEKTLGAIAPNERGKDGILSRSGRYATGGKGATPYNCYTDGDDTSRRNAAAQPQSGTSIFDPVVCELAYRWFCPQGGSVLDPFAGGSVRGIVAAKLGRQYTGIDLSARQLEANRLQGKAIVPDAPPNWVHGDSSTVAALAAKKAIPGKYDFVFSCPPYFDLEVYSDGERDLSTMTWEGFCATYRAIVKGCCQLLKPDRFACFVVGDIRDRKTGCYRGLVGETINAFAAAGAVLYNEAILVTAVGSLSIRVGRQFDSYRKLGKTHQQVLVFVKGDPKKAAAAVGPVEMADLDTVVAAAEDGAAD